MIEESTEIFAEYDSADYLKTDEDILNYLNVTLEESDSPAAIAYALEVVARARAKNFSQLARDANITREGLYKVLSKNSNPTLSTFLNLTKALGLQLAFKPSTAHGAAATRAA